MIRTEPVRAPETLDTAFSCVVHDGPGIDNALSMTVYGGTINTYYYLTDHLGTVHALADTNGVIVESYKYDAWGRVLGVYDQNGAPLTESAVGNRILWQGREYSWKTGLYYFRARWYDPITGRWLSNDPIGISGGLNQYVFCANNPINCRDPYGLLDSLIGGDVHGSLVLGAGPVGGLQGIAGPEGVSGIYGYHNLLVLEGEPNNETYGLDIGVAGQIVFGLGNGSYEGPFRSVNLGFTWLAGSVYWSPGAWTGVWQGKPGWIGINIGGSFGSPLTGAWEKTWFHKLFPGEKKPKKCGE